MYVIYIIYQFIKVVTTFVRSSNKFYLYKGLYRIVNLYTLPHRLVLVTQTHETRNNISV